MILDTTTKSLRIVLAEAMTTSNCDITASFADQAVSGFLPASSDTASNGVTPVTAVAAPAAGVVRNVREVRLHNNDTVPHGVTLQLDDNGTIRIVLSGEVPAGGNFLYTPEAVSATAESETLAGLSDVLINNPSDGQDLVWNAADNRWENDSRVVGKSAGAGSGLAGTDVAITGGAGDGAGVGGAINLVAGNGGVTANGGSIVAGGGQGGATSGNGGGIEFDGGNAGGSGIGGGVFFFPGSGAAAGAGGALSGTAGNGGATGNGGAVNLNGGPGGSTSGDGGTVTLTGGAAATTGNGNGGTVTLLGGNGAGGGAAGGDVVLSPGGGATAGHVKLPGLPTADPGITGALWVDPATHILHVSP